MFKGPESTPNYTKVFVAKMKLCGNGGSGVSEGGKVVSEEKSGES